MMVTFQRIEDLNKPTDFCYNIFRKKTSIQKYLTLLNFHTTQIITFVTLEVIASYVSKMFYIFNCTH